MHPPEGIPCGSEHSAHIMSDMAPADMGAIDMSTIDMSAIDMSAIDMSAIDVTPEDMEAIDMATRDLPADEMAAIDMAARDMAVADMAAIDMAARDMAVADMAAIDLAARDMAAADVATMDMAAIEVAAGIDPIDAEAAHMNSLQEVVSSTTDPAAEAQTKQLLPSPPSKRYHFNPPRLHCGKCASALCVITAGLVLWVGIWDLLDYHIIPVVTRYLVFHNMSALGVCEHAPGDEWVAGLSEIYSHPYCAITKAILLVIGILGLYVTHALYGVQDDMTYKRLP